MTKILILGGSGILSTDVLKECLKREISVTCITRGTRDYRIPDGVKIIHGNVSKIDEVKEQLDKNYDAILDFLSFDVKGLKYKLDYLADICEQYFFVSSATAYCFKDEIITEETQLGNEFWDYGDKKVQCESWLRRNYEHYNIKYTIIRPYITYGKTRIPFGVIPVSGEYWSLAARILNNKPVVLWDDGKARCTLTHTEDFARGFVDLIGNERAYNEAFHITSNEVLTWKDVLGYVSKELDATPVIFHMDTPSVVKFLPEYEGVLNGDKARDRVFDNSKIMSVAPTFKNFKPFSVGIAETIQNYKENEIERTILYRWDGKIDWTILQYAKQNNLDVSNYRLKYVNYEGKNTFKKRFHYMQGRYPFLGSSTDKIYKIVIFPKRVIRYLLKKIKHKANPEQKRYQELRQCFHELGENCFIGNCDFGLDGKLISIGNNVHLSDAVKFINYRPTAEHFEKVFGDGQKKDLRDLGPIIVEDNVFVSYGVTILPNVKIGKNSLILEESIVMEDVPENVVACGNPAKVIGTIEDWYNDLLQTNDSYPWYEKGYDHAKIVKERERYFFR